MLALFTITILLSALLLFLVQPMAAKMFLPLLGGSPAVWNTCMVFFQAMLLAGYLYAHLLTRWIAPRFQVLVHAAIVGATFLFLPVGSTAEAAPSGARPELWLLGWLTLSIGPPFFALATTTPLLQRWFAGTTHRDAADPYFLYAASNVGSMVALLGYPLLIEPVLRLRPQTPWHPSQLGMWSAGYAVVVVSVIACGASMLRRRAVPNGLASGDSAPSRVAAVGLKRRLLWVVLALVPCSTMLGATHLITSEIASVPLLWVVPLALYLLTFILAFSRRLRIPSAWAGGGLAFVCVAVASTMLTSERPSAWLLVPLHLATVFGVGLVCHGRLAADRPPAERLTGFYLLIAVGGVLGGGFNSLIAPFLFDTLAEYPIALVAACLLRPAGRPRESLLGSRWLDWAYPLFVGLLAVLLHMGLGGRAAPIGIGLTALSCLIVVRRPLRFGLCLAAVLTVGVVLPRIFDPPVYAERTFFGIHEVRSVEGPPLEVSDRRTGVAQVIRIPFHQLIHGTTRHGNQAQVESLRREPTTYYHRSGPLGQVFEALQPRDLAGRVAIVGLGAGTIAAYGGPASHFTFYEIDAEVAAIARNRRLFTYLLDSPARVDVVIGDGRLSLGLEPDASFGLIVIDAFSSDSVPVHLITREAIRLYLQKLRPGGLLAFHQSSQYLDLTRVLDAVAADLGLTGLVTDDDVTDVNQLIQGKDASTWAVLARDTESLGSLATDGRWLLLPRDLDGAPTRRHLWTDDYSNVLGVLKVSPRIL